MRNILCLFFMCCFAGTGFLRGAETVRPFGLDTRPARSIKISKKLFAEFRPGTDRLEIVVPEGSLKTVKFAADELKRFLDKRLKTSVPIQKRPSGKKYAVILGRNRFSREAKINDSGLCRDAFIIRTIGRNIYILGRDTDEHPPQKLFTDTVKRNYWMVNEYSLLSSERATLFGVYDFLERFAGIRFYFPSDDFTVIPEGKMRIPVTNILDRPDFEARTVSLYNGSLLAGADRPLKKSSQKIRNYIDPEKSFHYLRTRLGSAAIPIIHGLRFHYLPKRFAQKKPEYLALVDPKGSLRDPANRSKVFPCLSQPGVLNVVKQDVRDYFKGKKKLANQYPWHYGGFLNRGANLALPDGYKPCRCAQCRPHFTSLQRSSDHVWKFTAEVARSMKQEKLPGYITQLAYDSYLLPPSKGITLPDNLYVYVCVNGPWDLWSMDALERGYQLIRKWYEKTGRKNCLWNYSLEWGGLNLPDVPNPTPRAFAQFYRLVSPYVNGIFNETNPKNYFHHFMTYYMFGRISWDNSADIEAIFSEHYRLLYGKGSTFMQNFFDELESLWLRKVYKVLPSNSMGPFFAAPSPYDLWFKIYGPEKLRELKGYLDNAKKAERKNPLIQRRIDWIKRNFYDSLVRGGEKFRKMHSLTGDLIFRAEPLKAGEKITIDGSADESAWKRAEKIHVQGFSLPSSKRPDPVEVKSCIDKKDLYVFFKCSEPDIKKMKDYSGTDANQVEIFLQSSKSPEKTCLQLIINSGGEVYGLHRRTRRIKPITRIGRIPGLKASVKKMSDHWNVEVVIPLRAIPDFREGELYGNFCRQQKNEKDRFLYSWIPEKDFYVPKRFGRLYLPLGVFGSTVGNIDYSLPGTWSGIRNIKAVDGTLEVQKSVLMSGPLFTIDKNKTYTLSLQCAAKGVKKGQKSTVLAGFQVFDSQNREIQAVHVGRISDVLILAGDVKKNDISVRIKGNIGKLRASRAFCMVYGAKEDLTDLPNRNIFGQGIRKVEKQDGGFVVTFHKPVPVSLKAGTKVRVHCSGGYLYTAGAKYIDSDWMLMQGSIRGIAPVWNNKTWPAGSVRARVVILSNWNRKAQAIRYRQISFTVR